jgi:hypothetical protein
VTSVVATDLTPQFAAARWAGFETPGSECPLTKFGTPPELHMGSGDSFEPPRQGDWLAPLLQGWAKSQQAVGLYDEQDRRSK